MAQLQPVDGIGLNAITFGIVSAVVLALVGTITLLFKMVTSGDRQQIVDLKLEKRELQAEKQELMDALVDVLRTAHRSTDVADDAARELLKRRPKKP